jgi:hypothetical protein
MRVSGSQRPEGSFKLQGDSNLPVAESAREHVNIKYAQNSSTQDHRHENSSLDERELRLGYDKTYHKSIYVKPNQFFASMETDQLFFLKWLRKSSLYFWKSEG